MEAKAGAAQVSVSFGFFMKVLVLPESSTFVSVSFGFFAAAVLGAALEERAPGGGFQCLLDSSTLERAWELEREEARIRVSVSFGFFVAESSNRSAPRRTSSRRFQCLLDSSHRGIAFTWNEQLTESTFQCLLDSSPTGSW